MTALKTHWQHGKERTHHARSVAAMLCALAALLAPVVLAAQTRILWPTNDATNVTTAPVIAIRFAMPIDSGNIVWQWRGCPDSTDSAHPLIRPTFYLTPKIVQDSVPDSLWFLFAFTYTASRVDDSTITISYTNGGIHLGTQYEFAIDSNSKIIVDTTNGGRDTTGLHISPVVFTTELPPPQIMETSVDDKNTILKCNDTISVRFNRPIFSASPTCGPIIELWKQVVQNDTDTTIVSYDSVAVTAWLSADSTAIYVLPDSGFAPGYAYSMYIHMNRITGITGGDIGETFFIRGNYIVTLGVAGADSTVSIPADCMPTPGVGDFSVAVGDTFYITTPDTVSDVVFDHWQCNGDPQYDNDTSLSLAITYQCGLTYNDTLTAIYKNLPADTLVFPDTNNVQITVDGGDDVIVDSIDPQHYILKGNANTYAHIYLIPDSGYAIDSSKSTIAPDTNSLIKFSSSIYAISVRGIRDTILPYTEPNSDSCSSYTILYIAT